MAVAENVWMEREQQSLVFSAGEHDGKESIHATTAAAVLSRYVDEGAMMPLSGTAQASCLPVPGQKPVLLMPVGMPRDSVSGSHQVSRSVTDETA